MSHNDNNDDVRDSSVRTRNSSSTACNDDRNYDVYNKCTEMKVNKSTTTSVTGSVLVRTVDKKSKDRQKK